MSFPATLMKPPVSMEILRESYEEENDLRG